MDFLLFMYFWIFDTISNKRLIKNNNVKTFKEKQTNKQFSTQVSKKHTTKHHHKTLKVLMHGHVVMLMHEYPSSPIRHMRLG